MCPSDRMQIQQASCLATVDCKPVLMARAKCMVDRKCKSTSKNTCFKAEAVDEVGNWCACTVEEVGNYYVMVSFDSWNAEWNCRICDPREIRNQTVPDHKRKRRNISSTKFSSVNNAFTLRRPTSQKLM